MRKFMFGCGIKTFFLLAFGLFAYNKSDAQPEGTRSIRIDPSSALGGTAYEVFEEVKYIPLETDRKSLFGKIDKLWVTEKHFIIWDRNTNSILIFLVNGRFHARISGGDPSNETGSYLSSICVDNFNSEIVFRKGRSGILHYNFDGKKLYEVKDMPLLANWYIFPDRRIVGYQYSVHPGFYPDSTAYELTFYKKGKAYLQALPYNTKKTPLTSNDMIYPDHSPFYQTDQDTLVLFTRPYDNAVYGVTPSGVNTLFRLILPLANALPEDFSISDKYRGARMKFIEAHPEIAYNISHTYLVGQYLFLKLAWFGYEYNKYSSFMYDLRTGRLIAVQRVISDSSSQFLPIATNSTEFMNDNFFTCDGKYLYTAYSSLSMFQEKESTQDKQIHYDKDMQRYFSLENKKSNPVIVRIKPR